MKQLIETAQGSIMERKQRIHWAIQEKKQIEKRILEDLEVIDALESEIKLLEGKQPIDESLSKCVNVETKN